MKRNYKKLLLVGIMIMGAVSFTGCAKVKEMLPKGNKDKSTEVSSTAKQERPVSLGQYQDMVAQKAALIIADKFKIDVTPETVQAFITDVVGDELTPPHDMVDINNNPAVIKEIIGEAGYLKSFIPPYVEEMLGRLLEEEYSSIPEEQLAQALLDYSEYLDSLGVAEESRLDYVQHIIALESMTMQIDQEYYAAYAEAAVEILKTFEPEYLETLGLE